MGRKVPKFEPEMSYRNLEPMEVVTQSGEVLCGCGYIDKRHPATVEVNIILWSSLHGRYGLSRCQGVTIFNPSEVRWTLWGSLEPSDLETLEMFRRGEFEV